MKKLCIVFFICFSFLGFLKNHVFAFTNCINPSGYACICSSSMTVAECTQAEIANGCEPAPGQPWNVNPTHNCPFMTFNCQGYYCPEECDGVGVCISACASLHAAENNALGNPCVTFSYDGSYLNDSNYLVQTAYACAIAPGFGSCPICTNICNTPEYLGGCQTQNSVTCSCECPANSSANGNDCVADDPLNLFNLSNCTVCDASAQFGTTAIHDSGVYWMPFPNPPGVTLDMMFFGTDKDVTLIHWNCLASSGRFELSITDPLVTYSDIYSILKTNCSFDYYNVPDFGGIYYRAYATYIWFDGEKPGVGACAGLDLSIHTEGYIGELKSSNVTESHGTMFHSEGHTGFKNRGQFGGGYEIHLP